MTPSRRGFLASLLALPAAAKAWALAPRDLVIPIAPVSDSATGISMRFIRGWAYASPVMLKAGDIFTIEGSYDTPGTRRRHEFVVTADVESDS